MWETISEEKKKNSKENGRTLNRKKKFGKMEIEILVWTLQDFEDFVIKVFLFRKRSENLVREELWNKQTNKLLFIRDPQKEPLLTV